MTRTLLAGILLAVVCLLVFAWLAWRVAAGPVIWFDASVREAVHGWASPEMTYVMRGVTELGSYRFLLPFGAFVTGWLWKTGRRRAALLLVIAALGGQLLTEMLKLMFQRARPDALFGYRAPTTFAFPSGHAMAAASFYGVLAAILYRRLPGMGRRILLWTAAAVLALSIGLSRIYLGVHYPSDVVGGYAAAIVWVAAVWAAAEKLRRRTGIKKHHI